MYVCMYVPLYMCVCTRMNEYIYNVYACTYFVCTYNIICIFIL